MDIQACIQGRRSVRAFEDKQVSEETLQAIVETASYAPSWKNTQTTRYIAVRDAQLKERVVAECVAAYPGNQKTIANAPVLMVVTTISPRSGFERDGSASTSKGTHWESFDAGIAVQTLCLAAYEQGLGSVILGIFDEEKVRAVLDIPEQQKVSALVPLGYPAETPTMPPRKAVSDLLTLR